MIEQLPVRDEPLEPAVPGHHPSGGVAAELRAATALLTRLPFGGPSNVTTGSRAFPVVGAIVGGAGAVPIAVLGSTLPPVAAILAIALMAALSGGLHLDGLADTTDALIAVGPDAAERARKDPRIGAGGASALILVLGLEVASLTMLVLDSGALAAAMGLIAAASTSRAVPVALARLARGQAGMTGMGAWFAMRITTPDALVATAAAVAISITCGLGASVVGITVPGIAGMLAGLTIGLVLVRVRGQLDGDLLGASVELAFAATLVVAAALAV